MNNFKNRGLFIALTLIAFLILALASYTLSAPPTHPETNQPEVIQNER